MCLVLLPLELWMNHILCLLPVKTLLVMRAVSKFFLSIIDDESESLASIHLRSSSSNPTPENRCVLELVLDYDYSGYPSKLFSFTSYPATCIIGQTSHLETMATKFRFPVAGNGSLVGGSLDGLVLLKVRDERDGVDGLEGAVLWNPSLRKTRQLPAPSDSVSGFSSIELGLGYDPCSKDYKVLAMFSLMQRCDDDIDNDNLQGWGVWVYSVLKTRSWTPVFDSGLSMWHTVNFWHMCEPLPFKGCLFWIETGWGSPRGASQPPRQRLTRFHLATHQFRYSDMPPYTLKKHAWVKQRLTKIDGGGGRSCLAVTAESEVDEATGRVTIWTMHDIDTMAWTRRYLPYGWHSMFWIRDTCEVRYMHYNREFVRRVETVPYVESMLLLN